MDQSKFTPLVTEKKGIIQSRQFTFAKYHFSVYEKRIIAKIISDRNIQREIEVQLNTKGKGKNLGLFPKTISYQMKIAELCNDTGEYERYKEAFSSLALKGFQYEDNKVWAQLSFIAFPVIEKSTGLVFFQIHETVYRVITNVGLGGSLGYRKYRLDVMFKLKSPYSMRLYEMFSQQDKGTSNGFVTIAIETLKDWFDLQGKYNHTGMFIKRVIEVAKNELDEKADYSFNYKLEKSGKTRKSDTILFHINYIPENIADETKLTESESKGLALISENGNLSHELYTKLQEEFGFELSEIHSSKAHFYIAEQEAQRVLGKKKGTLALLDYMTDKKNYALKEGKRDWKSYVIGCVIKRYKTQEQERRNAKIENFSKTKTNEKEQSSTQEKDINLDDLKDRLAKQFTTK